MPEGKVAHFVGFDKHIPNDDAPDIPNTEDYVELEPTVPEFLREHAPTKRSVVAYFYRLFPFIDWIGKYNLTWLSGDLIAGITVGAVVVPQSMAYAGLALLDVQYGLYSSFMGVLIYWFFATSKDITIGPVGVMSMVTGDVVAHARETLDIPAHFVASALALITGCILTALGLLRLGWIVDLIPLPAICAFMTGGGLTVLCSQVPKILGIPGIHTRRAPYLVIIDTLKGLPTARIDAALGLTALLMLYLIRFGCNYGAKKYPHKAKTFFFLSTLRTAFTILLYTGISAGVNIHRRDDPLFRIVGDVPRGFTQAEVPRVNSTIIKSFASKIPSSIIVMLIEHISISKSFGRINGYTIDPSQELIAIGVTNILGPFLGAYPATGSFSRTAIKSKCGVRTPFAGVITAVVVLLAVYALTAVFFYIPNSALGAVIFHAVGDVLTPPRTLWQFWRVSPLEMIIFLAGVLVTVFTSIENGIYTTIAVSFAVLLWRLFLSNGHILGTARIRTVKATSGSPGSFSDSEGKDGGVQFKVVGEPTGDSANTRTGFFPLDHDDGSNPGVDVEEIHPGVFIYRPAEGFNYPNANRYLGHLTSYILKKTRRTDYSRIGKLGDRPWNDGLPRNAQIAGEDNRPILRAVILDFSAVNNTDVTAAQALIDTRNQLARYAAPGAVEWRFANIRNRWSKRALASAGFGYRSAEASSGAKDELESIFSVVDLDGSKSIASSDEKVANKQQDIESGEITAVGGDIPKDLTSASLIPLQGLNRPFFHVDLEEAITATLLSVQRRT